MVTIQPDPAEEAMLRVLAAALLEEAGRLGRARCRFRHFRLRARRLSATRRHLTVRSDKGVVIDADLDVS